MNNLRSYAKFFIKVRIVGALRSLFLFFAPGTINRDGWEDRMLIVNLESLGDLVVFIGVLKHYKKRFPARKIFLLIKAGTGFEAIAKGNFADEVITADTKRFSRDSAYGASLIRQLCGIGFKTVINQDFSAAEIMAKIISVNLGAEEVIGYAGMGLEFRSPFDPNQRAGVAYAAHSLVPKYTKLIPTQDPEPPANGELASALNHYIAIYEQATGFHESEYAMTLPIPTANSSDAAEGKYVFMSAGSSVPYKEWKIEYFAEVARQFHDAGFRIIVAGVKNDAERYRQLEELCNFPIDNRTGKTSFIDYLNLINGAAAVFTNDSSAVHVAVAFQKPSLCVTGGGQFGMFANYGYSDRNFWAYQKTPCYGDNWMCHLSIPHGEMAPCLAAIKLNDVLAKVDVVISLAKQSTLSAGEFFRGNSF